MSDPIILSDKDDPNTPFSSISKKPKAEPDLLFPSVLVLDDDPTPQKLSLGPAFNSDSTLSFVAEAPLSELSVIRYFNAGPSVCAWDPELEDTKLSAFNVSRV